MVKIATQSTVRRREVAAAASVALSMTCLSALAPSAAVAAPGDDLTCRASALRTTALPSPTGLPAGSPLVDAEPVRANAPGEPCSTQSSEVGRRTVAGPANADALQAFTARGTASGEAQAGASQPDATLGSLSISAATVQAAASVRCEGNNPVLAGSSRVTGLRINGQLVTLPADDAPFSQDVGSGVVRVNESVTEAGRRVQRAVRVTVPGVGEVILAEAIAGGTATACAAATSGGGTGGGGTGGTGGNGGGTGSSSGSEDDDGRVCPAGSELDPASSNCVIRTGGGSGSGSGGGTGTGGGSGSGGGTNGSGSVIVVGRPFEGPKGGSVVSLANARKRFKSACLRGRGLPYVVLGTRRSQKITGTSGADRILLLGGNDRGAGGLNHDCIDGGSGRDRVSGGLGNDRLIGNKGNDRIDGAGGADRLTGAAGNDRIDGGDGRDRLLGGAGRDNLLGGSAGDRLWGQAGNDKVLGGSGNDMANGGSGRDVLGAGHGRDRVFGGPGNDLLRAQLPAPAAKRLDGGRGFDRAVINGNERSRIVRVEKQKVL